MNETFGMYLRRRREGRGIGLCALARKLGVAQSTLSKLEVHGRRAVSDDLLRRLAAELGEDVEVFLLRAGRIPPDVLEILRCRPDLIGYVRRAGIRAGERSVDGMEN